MHHPVGEAVVQCIVCLRESSLPCLSRPVLRSNLEGVHDLAQFVSHALEAMCIAWDLHAPPVPPPPPPAVPASPHNPPHLSRKASRERLVKVHTLKLAEAEDALFGGTVRRMSSLERRPLETPRGGGGGGTLLMRRMSRSMPKLPAPVAALEKEKRNISWGGAKRPSADSQGKDSGAPSWLRPGRFSDPLPGLFNRAFAEKGKVGGSRVVRWEEEEKDRGVDLTPQPVRTTSMLGDDDELPGGGHHESHAHATVRGGTRWEELKAHGVAPTEGEEEEQPTLQVRVRLTCVRLTIAVARETFTSLVVQDVMVRQGCHKFC